MVVGFPFSDLSQVKRRPALVLASVAGDDLVLCQITSQLLPRPESVPLEDADFTEGGLHRSSRIRPDRLFTVDSRIVAYRAGTVCTPKLQETRRRVVRIVTGA